MGHRYHDEQGFGAISVFVGLLAIVAAVVFALFQFGILGGHATSNGSGLGDFKAAHRLVGNAPVQQQLQLCAQGQPSIYAQNPTPTQEAICLSKEGAGSATAPNAAPATTSIGNTTSTTNPTAYTPATSPRGLPVPAG